MLFELLWFVLCMFFIVCYCSIGSSFKLNEICKERDGGVIHKEG